MNIEFKKEIDEYIEDWYYGEKQYEFAFELGEFLWYFLDYIDSLDTTESTKNKHRSNCWCIGILESNYGYREKFYPKILEGGPHYEYEFKRKFSDSKYAIQSYRATWNKLDRYIKEKKYLINYVSQKYEDEPNLISELEDLVLRIFNKLKSVDEEVEGKEIINKLRKVTCNYIDYEDRMSDEHYEHYQEQINEVINQIELVKKDIKRHKQDEELVKLQEELEEKQKRLQELILNMN